MTRHPNAPAFNWQRLDPAVTDQECNTQSELWLAEYRYASLYLAKPEYIIPIMEETPPVAPMRRNQYPSKSVTMNNRPPAPKRPDRSVILKDILRACSRHWAGMASARHSRAKRAAAHAGRRGPALPPSGPAPNQQRGYSR